MLSRSKNARHAVNIRRRNARLRPALRRARKTSLESLEMRQVMTADLLMAVPTDLLAGSSHASAVVEVSVGSPSSTVAAVDRAQATAVDHVMQSDAPETGPCHVADASDANGPLLQEQPVDVKDLLEAAKKAKDDAEALVAKAEETRDKEEQKRIRVEAADKYIESADLLDDLDDGHNAAKASRRKKAIEQLKLAVEIESNRDEQMRLWVTIAEQYDKIAKAKLDQASCDELDRLRVEAADSLKASGDAYFKAGKLLEAKDQFIEAAKEYVAANLNNVAAGMYEKAAEMLEQWVNNTHGQKGTDSDEWKEAQEYRAKAKELRE